jgi:hypothetical protein
MLDLPLVMADNGNKQQATSNKQQATSDRRQATGDRESGRNGTVKWND